MSFHLLLHCGGEGCHTRLLQWNGESGGAVKWKILRVSVRAGMSL